MFETVTKPPVTRLKQILDYTERRSVDIARHLGINVKTLYTYGEGTREIPLNAAKELMAFCRLDINLLFNDAPLKRCMTGFPEIDKVVSEIYKSPELAGKTDDECYVDPIAHYYADEYRCCSSTYSDAEGDRHQAVFVDFVEWQTQNILRTKKRYSVNRAIEWQSFCERVSKGQKAQTTLVQANIVSSRKIMVVARIKWLITPEIASWAVGATVETIDFLKLEHDIDSICSHAQPFLLKNKLWTQYLGDPSHESMSQSCPKYQEKLP